MCSCEPENEELLVQAVLAEKLLSCWLRQKWRWKMDYRVYPTELLKLKLMDIYEEIIKCVDI